jgi:hypothetical protein
MTSRFQLLLSHSSRLTWQLCHRKYYWSNIERIQPKKEPDVFARGKLGHQLVDMWRFKRADDAHVLAKANAFNPEFSHAMLEYMNHYRDLPEDNDVAFLEGFKPFSHKVGTYITAQGAQWEVVYTGECDGVCTWNGHHWIVERKFTGQIPSNLVARFQLDDQVRGYYWYYKHKYPQMAGARVEITRCTKYPEVVHDYVLLDEGDELRFLQDLLDVAIEMIEAISTSRFPMSPHSCFNWGECVYRRLCLNPDRAAFATTLGYRVETLSHEEETHERAHGNRIERDPTTSEIHLYSPTNELITSVFASSREAFKSAFGKPNFYSDTPPDSAPPDDSQA